MFSAAAADQRNGCSWKCHFYRTHTRARTALICMCGDAVINQRVTAMVWMRIDPLGLCVWILGLHLVELFWKDWGGGGLTLLEEMLSKGGIWGFKIYMLSLPPTFSIRQKLSAITIFIIVLLSWTLTLWNQESKLNVFQN